MIAGSSNAAAASIGNACLGTLVPRIIAPLCPERSINH
jgi:hypothetical protein